MNSLAELSTNELNRIKQDIAERKESILTKEGFDGAKKVMLAMFDYLANSGYKIPDTDYDEMAGVYADQLREHIVLYGYDVIKNAVREFVRSDRRDYHPIPTAGQLIETIESIADNPKHEIRRREHEQFIENMKRETQKELQDAWNSLSEDERKELEEKYGCNR